MAHYKSHRIPEDYVPVQKQYFHVNSHKVIAYRKFHGSCINGPQILYVPGFFAGMDLPKTVAVEQFARENGLTNVRYDPTCCGSSTGDLNTIEFEDWLKDALTMVDHICDPELPIIIVSSSVGSWVGQLRSLDRSVMIII